MDDYHIITSNDNMERSSETLAELRPRAKRHLASIVNFIQKTEKGLFVGTIGKTEDVIGEHEFAREAPDGRYSGVGRKIAFNHAYHCDPSIASIIPDLKELQQRQYADLLHVLTEAHAGHEPVLMKPVTFSTSRKAGTDWDRIAADVEAGKCQGGFFDPEGRLLERFESVTKEAQKKMVEKIAQPSAMVQAEAMAIRPAFSTIAAVTIGVAVTSWAAWKLIELDRKNRQPSGSLSRA